MKRFVNEHSWLLLSLRIGKVFSCRDQRTLRTLDSMYYYTQLSYLWKNETYHQAEVLIWRRTGLKCDRKETDEKRSGGGRIWCVLLKTNEIENKDYLEIDGIVPQIRKQIDWLLNGTSTADFQIIIRLFQLVQSFVSLSNRFW